MTIHIIYTNYLNKTGTEMSVGGIQTYIRHLSHIFNQQGINVVIYQTANKSFEISLQDSYVVGVPCQNGKKVKHVLFEECMSRFDIQKDILIWGTESLVCKYDKPLHTIAIQHGIYWDKPLNNRSPLNLALNILRRIKTFFSTTKLVRIPNLVVCVDYNFINWFRASTVFQNINYAVIPNFSYIPEYDPHKQMLPSTIKIVFARRFWVYRGTRLFVEAIKEILNDYSNIEIIIAGEGPDEEYINKELSSYENVSFLKYSSEESISFHKDKHIAVIPTLGSEGTSLSLLESMASQCAVICTDVGGMTNIVIDNYNGLIIPPDKDSLVKALRKLINDESLRKKLSDNAFDTVKTSFSLEEWQNKWLAIVKQFL